MIGLMTTNLGAACIELPRQQRNTRRAGRRTGRAGGWMRPPEIALAAWVGTSLLGLVLGLGLAKYSQAWAEDTFDPAAVLGALVVVMSTILAWVAGVRYLVWAPGSGTASRALFVLSLTIVVALCWAALAIIAFAGWDFPRQEPSS